MTLLLSAILIVIPVLVLKKHFNVPRFQVQTFESLCFVSSREVRFFFFK